MIEGIDQNVLKVIMHSPKSLLFDLDNIWVKNENPTFDVTMRSYDRTELCELTGFYILNVLSSEFGEKNIRLNRGDGLSCLQNKAGPQAEKDKKKM